MVLVDSYSRDASAHTRKANTSTALYFFQSPRLPNGAQQLAPRVAGRASSPI